MNLHFYSISQVRTTVDIINFDTEQLSGNVLFVFTTYLLLSFKIFFFLHYVTTPGKKDVALLLLGFILFSS